MKRTYNLLAIILSVTMLASVISGNAIALESTSNNSKYTIDLPYEYPVQPGTDEWFALETHGNRAAISQIPDDILHALTTNALVETVINYPFMSDMLLFSDGETGYQIVRDNFNGLQELEVRPDGLETLSRFYAESKTRANFDISILGRPQTAG